MNIYPFLTKEHKAKIAKSMKGKKNHKGHNHTKETKENISYSCSKSWAERKQYRLTHYGLDKKQYEFISDNTNKLLEAQREWEEKHPKIEDDDELVF